jgi:chromosome segregation ATPase
VRRDRESSTKLHAIAVSEATAELVELAKKLEPLEKEAAVARKKAEGLADQLRRIAKKIADTEALLVSVKGEKLDRAAIQSDIATLKADQKVVQRDEPMIAAELDALEPRMAAIRAQQTDAEKRKADAEAAEAEDQRRTTELYEAIGAKRKVVERAAADAEAARDRVLFELGERLYVDRPASFSAQLAPIDQIDLELGDSDRRAMELREILSNVDRMKIARGVAVIVVVLAAVASFVAWVVVMLG